MLYSDDSIVGDIVVCVPSMMTPFLLHSTTAIACSSTLLADTVQVKFMLSPTVNEVAIGVIVTAGGRATIKKVWIVVLYS